MEPLIEPKDLIDAWGWFLGVRPGEPDCATLYADRQGCSTHRYSAPVLVMALPRDVSQDLSDQRFEQAHHNHSISFFLGMRVDDLGADATVRTVFCQHILPHDQACAAFDAAIADTWDRVLLDWRKPAPVAMAKVLPDPGGAVAHVTPQLSPVRDAVVTLAGRRAFYPMRVEAVRNSGGAGDVGWQVTDADARREVKGQKTRSCRRRSLGLAGTVRRYRGPGSTVPSGGATLQAAGRMLWAKVE